MAPRVPTALLYRYTSSGIVALLMVRGHSAIRAFERTGWTILCHSTDVQYADIEETRQLEIARFNDWRDAWRIGP